MSAASETEEILYPFDWDELLVYIEDRKVIPIVGKELLVVNVSEAEVLLEHYLAAQLAKALNLPKEPPSVGLNEVAMAYLMRGGRRAAIYAKLKSILEATHLEPPSLLRKLAAITDFNLFVSTTFDALMLNALNEVRFGGDCKAKCLTFSPYLPSKDIPAELAVLDHPHVFHIFGTVSAATDYAVTEEDTLEFIFALQAPDKRPKLLFDELKGNHLLFLGCGFPDWLMRFFMRTVANERLLTRDTSRVIAGAQTILDNSLALFFQHVRALLYPLGNLQTFVETLHQRWLERHPGVLAKTEAATPRAQFDLSAKMEGGAIFLSYAREDMTTALNMKKALEEAGLTVWFDQSSIKGGSDWEREIRANIRNCSIFIPLLSHNTLQLEGYFRKEWNWAVDRAQSLAKKYPFIQSIITDDTPEGADNIEDYFWTRQVQRFPNGVPTPEFVQHLKETFRTYQLNQGRGAA
jgi:hypothetical protein